MTTALLGTWTAVQPHECAIVLACSSWERGAFNECKMSWLAASLALPVPPGASALSAVAVAFGKCGKFHCTKFVTHRPLHFCLPLPRDPHCCGALSTFAKMLQERARFVLWHAGRFEPHCELDSSQERLSTSHMGSNTDASRKYYPRLPLCASFAVLVRVDESTRRFWRRHQS